MTLLLVLLISWLLTYLRAEHRIWPLMALGLRWSTNPPRFPGNLFLSTPALSAALLLNLPPLRRAILTRPIFRLFKIILPALSDTERAALEACTIGWDGELFSGGPLQYIKDAGGDRP